MRPLSVITLIILGSSVAITSSLAAVIIVVLVLGDEYPRLAAEFGPLTRSFVLFVGMTIIAAASFYTQITRHAWRHWAQGAMWAAFVGVGWYYWP